MCMPRTRPGDEIASRDNEAVRTGVKVGLSVAICVSATAVWLGLPMFAAAGLALDHPAWSDPDDPAVARAESSMSWFPPGTRHEWDGAASGQRRVAVDPWGNSFGPILWTVLCVGAAGLGVRFIVRA